MPCAESAVSEPHLFSLQGMFADISSTAGWAVAASPATATAAAVPDVPKLRREPGAAASALLLTVALGLQLVSPAIAQSVPEVGEVRRSVMLPAPRFLEQIEAQALEAEVLEAGGPGRTCPEGQSLVRFTTYPSSWPLIQFIQPPSRDFRKTVQIGCAFNSTQEDVSHTGAQLPCGMCLLRWARAGGTLQPQLDCHGQGGMAKPWMRRAAPVPAAEASSPADSKPGTELGADPS